MRLLSRVIYSNLITALLVICTIQAELLNVSFEEDLDFEFEKVEDAIDHQLAQAANEEHLLLQSDNSSFISPRAAGNANVFLDMILTQVQNIIRFKNLDRFKLPDFEKKIEKGAGIFKVKGTFRMIDGWLGNLSTISRKADATMRTEGTTIVLGSSLGLQIMEIGMKYEAKLGPTKVKGHVNAGVASNTVEFEGKVGYEAGRCVFSIRTLRVIDLGKIDIKATGLGPLNSLYSEIMTWLSGHFQKKIREVIEKKARQFLEKNLSKIKCPF